MSAEHSSPNFVVVFEERACFWTHSEEEADGILQDGLAKRLTKSLADRLHGAKPFLLHDPTEGHVEEITDHGYYCLTHREALLVFQADGWMACPVCSHPR